jgi:hypothetical protein
MRPSSCTPGLVPDLAIAIHVVLDDFGKAGRVYREVDETKADAATIVDDLLAGQFNNPVRIIAFNASEGWSRDVSEDIAWEVLARVRKEGRELCYATHSFLAFYVGTEEMLRVEADLV